MSTERDVEVNQLKLEMMEAFTLVVDRFCAHLKSEDGQANQNGRELVGMFDTLVVVKPSGGPEAVMVNVHVTDKASMDPEARVALMLALALSAQVQEDQRAESPLH